MENNNNIEELRDQLYSRQIASIGIESMKKISNLNILVIGLKGLGVEICKNIILQGPLKLSIFDNSIVNIRDFCCNYYLDKKDIRKKRRDESVYNKLKELNKYVEVEYLSKFNSIEELINKIDLFNIIVITEILKKEHLISINKKCREKNIKFIFSVILGLTGYIFSDFGKEHLIYNKNDKESKIFSIKNITNDINGLVEIEEINEGITGIKSVVFSDIKGMIELNNKEPIKIEIKNKYSFYIGDTKNYNKYIEGGIVKEKDKPIIMEYKGIEERLNMPYNEKGSILSFVLDDDEGKMPPELYFMILIEVINYYEDKYNNALFNNDNIENYQIIIENIKKELLVKKDIYWVKKIDKINENIIKNICINCKNEIPCLTSFLGGITAQEIIKSIGKYFPINQWAIFDFNDNYCNENKNNFKKISRYQNLYDILGYENILNLQNKNILLIGTGALGCELLKQFGLMGIKNVTAVDDDFIELSNLNRQFLFKENDIGKKKVEVACNSILKINPELNNYKGIQKKIAKETENFFNEKFWLEQDIIFCSLDSIEGRKYIDKQCILYEKPWINGGMNGCKGKTEVFIPFKTCCFSDINFESHQNKNDELSCTLRYFPTKIEECILWSKNLFYLYFIFYISDFKKIFNSKICDEILENQFEENNKNDILKLNILYNYLIIYKTRSCKDLYKLAINIFNLNFNIGIKELLEEYPINLQNDKGELFWKNKLIPSPIKIEENLNLYKSFIYYYTKILGYIFSIDNNEIKEINEKINNNYNLNEDKKILIKNIKKLKKEINIIQVNEIEFDKDKIENGHISFIHYCSCLRAINYNIPLCDKYKTFKIAGNIAPSTITINSTLSGLMSLELINLFCNEKNIRKYTVDLDVKSGSYIEENLSGIYYKNNYYDANVGCNYVVIPKKFSLWDKIEISGSKTLNEFILYMKNKYNIDITLISANDIIIFEKKILRELDRILELKKGKKKILNEQKKIEEIYLENKGTSKYDSQYLFLEISGNREDSRVLMPIIKYYYNK